MEHKKNKYLNKKDHVKCKTCGEEFFPDKPYYYICKQCYYGREHDSSEDVEIHGCMEHF